MRAIIACVQSRAGAVTGPSRVWTPRAGPARLYFKRALYLTDSPTASEERRGTTLQTGAHHLLFVDAVYHWVHGFYRFAPEEVPAIAAVLLAATRGPFRAARDTVAAMRAFIGEAVPLYALQHATTVVSRESAAARSHGTHTAPGALTVDDMVSRVRSEYEKMDPMGVLQAQKQFVKLCKVRLVLPRWHAPPVWSYVLVPKRPFSCHAQEATMYGSDYFPGKRTWKEKAPTPAPASTAGAGATSGRGPSAAAAAATETARAEDVIVAVGQDGVALLGVLDPVRATFEVPAREIPRLPRPCCCCSCAFCRCADAGGAHMDGWHRQMDRVTRRAHLRLLPR